MAQDAERSVDPIYSIIVPMKNEAPNIDSLVGEIQAAFAGRSSYEVVFVDDGSTDATPEVLKAACARTPMLRGLRHADNAGQSAAIRTGVRAARGQLIVTMDGDGQNDPADIPRLIEKFREALVTDPKTGMVAGQRRERKDSASKKMASVLANTIRRALLSDGTADTGCSLKIFPRALFLELPYFDHMHRYLPALVQREGLHVAFLDVGHRPRRAGRSNYTNLGRLLDSLDDLFGVMWLRKRRRLPGAVTEI